MAVVWERRFQCERQRNGAATGGVEGGEVVRSELYQGGFEFGRRACWYNPAGIAPDERVAKEPAAERAPLRWMVDFLVMTKLAPSTADLPRVG